MRIIRIGLTVWLFPPEPKVGDVKALREWKSVKLSFWEGVGMILRLKCLTIKTGKVMKDNEFLRREGGDGDD